MRQQQLAGHIPDGPHAGHIGGAVIIHLDEAALGEGNPGFLQAEILGVGAEPGGHQHLLHLDRLLPLGGIHHHGDRTLAGFDRAHLGAGEDLHAAFLEGLVQLLADLLILQGDDAREHLHQGDLAAVGIPDGGKLHPHRACSR